jgi:hypothetical protein
MRMQPAEEGVPIVSGNAVPWIPNPEHCSVREKPSQRVPRRLF